MSQLLLAQSGRGLTGLRHFDVHIGLAWPDWPDWASLHISMTYQIKNVSKRTREFPAYLLSYFGARDNQC